MSQFIITGFDNPDMRLANVKAIRVMTGYGLKDAKDIMEAVCAGAEQSVEAVGNDEEFMDDARRHGIQFRRNSVVRPYVVVHPYMTMLNALEQMPQHLTVAEVVGVMRAVRH